MDDWGAKGLRLHSNLPAKQAAKPWFIPATGELYSACASFSAVRLFLFGSLIRLSSRNCIRFKVLYLAL